MNTRMIQLLGFSPQETQIWNTLQKDSYNISELSGMTGFPRTTLYTAINSLKNRGLIETQTKGKAVIVSPISTIDLSNIFVENSTKANKSDFKIIRGKKAMLDVWQHAVSKNVKRIFVIQSSKSLVNMVNRFKPGEFIPLNNAIKKHKIIVDAIIREDNLPTYLNCHKDDSKLQAEILKSFIGRMADATFVKDTYLNNNAELIIIEGRAFLMNWKNEVAIEIDNTDTIELLKELFTLAKGYGRKMDFSAYTKEYLEKIHRH